MKHTNKIVTMMAMLCCYSQFSYAIPLGDNCENPDDIRVYAHCTSLNLPNYTNRFIREKKNVGASVMTFDVCMDNTFYLDDDIGKENSVKPGTYSREYSQCSSIDCTESKSLGTDTFTVNPDHSVTPYHFSVTPDLSYGSQCSYNPPPYTIMPEQNCQNSVYCASPVLPARTNRYIKIEENGNFAVTVCISNTMKLANKNPKDFIPGNHTVNFYQCDNVDCKQPKLVGQDAIKIDDNGNLNHSTYSFNMDPSYGETCTPIDPSAFHHAQLRR